MSRLSRLFTASIRRRIVASFAAVMLLVSVTAVGSFYQLTQVVRSATEMVPASARMGHLQDLALAISALDADLERFFVISGIQFQEAILEDLEAMDVALQAMQEGGGETVRPLVQELEEAQTALDGEVRVLVETESGDLSSGEINERILSVYSRIDDVKRLHGELLVGTQALLSGSIAEQEQAAARVMVQFLVLSLGVLVVGFISSMFVTRSIATPLASLADTAGRIADGELGLVPQVAREDEIGVLAHAFGRMTAQLRELIGGLEQRVEERTVELERRSRYLEATAQVGRAAASILEADELIGQMVDLVCERFGLYYVGLFLLDEAGEWAVLRAGTGEAGQVMLARGHRIRVGEGMIGWSVAYGESRVALEAGGDAVRLATTELPETRSEAALPLRSHGKIMGALSVQSIEPEFFDQATVTVLQTMADQVAVAISNAQLFQQAQEALEAERRAYGEIGQEAWAQFLRLQAGLGYRCDDRGVLRLPDDHLRVEPEAVTVAGARDMATAKLPELVLPVVIHGQEMGKIEAHKANAEEWTDIEIELMRSLGDQLSVALESARLFQDTQRRAAQERILSDVGARVRETLDMDTVLRTALREIGRSLDLAEVEVRLSTEQGSRVVDRAATGSEGGAA